MANVQVSFYTKSLLSAPACVNVRFLRNVKSASNFEGVLRPAYRTNYNEVFFLNIRCQPILLSRRKDNGRRHRQNTFLVVPRVENRFRTERRSGGGASLLVVFGFRLCKPILARIRGEPLIVYLPTGEDQIVE